MNTTDSPIPFSTGVAGLGGYALLMVFMGASFTWSFFKSNPIPLGKMATRVRRIFRIFLTLFVSVRIVWLCLHLFRGDDNVVFTLNRCALLFFLTAFTLVVFYWAEQFHKNYYETESFLPQLGLAFFVTNLIIYVFQIIVLILWFVLGTEREGNPLYEANIVTDVVVSTGVCVGFFVYGLLLFYVTRNNDGGDVEGRNTELLRIFFITIIFTLCFLCRVVMFLYRPITGYPLPSVLFYVFAYFVPELVPSVIQVILSETVQGQLEREDKFIKDLYDEGEEAIVEYREHNLVGTGEKKGLLK